MPEQSSSLLSAPELSLQELNRKAILCGRVLFAGHEPAVDAGPLLETPLQMLNNYDRFFSTARRAGSAAVRKFLGSPARLDPFSAQDTAEAAVGYAVKGVKHLDAVDLCVLSEILSLGIGETWVELSESRQQNISRLTELQRAAQLMALQVTPTSSIGQRANHLDGLRRKFLNQAPAGRGAGQGVSEFGWGVLKKGVGGRSSLLDLIYDWNLPTTTNAEEQHIYNRPMTARRRQLLTEAPANIIERLHLLDRMAMISFIVPGKTLGLPCDIAVYPPIGSTPHVVAPGALADFFILTPTPDNRHDLLQYETDEEGNQQVRFGQKAAKHWFRLYDNGQISDGITIVNTPSDATENTFEETGATDAFLRLRALFASLAFDALAPDEVIRRADVRGSVAATFRERQSGEAVIAVALRRQRAIGRTGLSDKQRTPRGWTMPEHTVTGFKRRLPEGARVDPAAVERARKHYEELQQPFEGLPPGYTFVKTHTRGKGPPRTVYRRARFRRDSRTRQTLAVLNIP